MIYPDWWEGKPPTLDSLADWCEKHQVGLFLDVRLPGDYWGFYSDIARAIYIGRRTPASWVVPVLAHETFHAAAGHDGHQSPPVEARIDEAVAAAIINPADYRFWETQYGWSTGGIASALNLPRWVVEAYRRKLAQTHPATL